MTNETTFAHSVKTEELRKRSLFIAVPMYGGLTYGPFMASCLSLTRLLIQYGIKHQFCFCFGESLVPRARNYLADSFLRSDCTHMVFLDGDLQFEPQDVMSLLALNEDNIIGGAYPKKAIKWENIVEAVKKHPDITPTDLQRIAAGFVFNLAEEGALHVGQPVQVMDLGTGFMCIGRKVFEAFNAQYPEKRYIPDDKGSVDFNGKREITAFFDCIIDEQHVVTSVLDGQTRTVGGSRRYLSEDFYFCQQWRNMGGEIWLCPWMKLTHIGTYFYQGDLAAHAEFLGKA